MSSKQGERLKEERERLGLTQANFAEKTGISSRALRNYESGTRVPDIRYLLETQDLGVDVHYVMSGIRETERDAWLRAQATVLICLATMLDLPFDELEAIYRREMKSMATFDSRSTEESINELVKLLENSPRVVVMSGDPTAIATDIDLLEGILSKVGMELPRDKRARVVSMLYRSFKASGKIDEQMIEDAVALASGDDSRPADKRV